MKRTVTTFNIYYTKEETLTLSIGTDEIEEYVSTHPDIFANSEPFPERGDFSEHEDYMGAVQTWLEDNTVILEEVGTPEEDSGADFSINEVEEG